MTKGAGLWQATDILFYGAISKVALQRADFSPLVTPDNATRLIIQLRKRVGSLSDAALRN
jgi:phospholipid transport system substrate-binding protein